MSALYAVFDCDLGKYVQFTHDNNPIPVLQREKAETKDAREALKRLERMQRIDEDNFTLEIRDTDDAEKTTKG